MGMFVEFVYLANIPPAKQDLFHSMKPFLLVNLGCLIVPLSLHSYNSPIVHCTYYTHSKYKCFDLGPQL